MGKIALLPLALLLVLNGPARGATRCTEEHGQELIAEGRLERAAREFSCVIDASPSDISGYRGRIEAELLLGRYSDAVRDSALVTARVLPNEPDAWSAVLEGYAARLKAAPDDVPALTGASYARWWLFEYTSAIHVLDHLVDVKPDDVYANLFRGSSRVLAGVVTARGLADLEKAIGLDPDNPHVRYVVSDAYTYGLPDPERALSEATLALDGGLDTPRIEAILAAALHRLGDDVAAVIHLARHIEMVTTDLVPTAALAPGGELDLALAPGRTFEIPVTAAAGETISLATAGGSADIWDTILVVLAPDGTPLAGNDDAKTYLAAVDFVAPQAATYRVRVTSFEAVSTGELFVTRD